MRNHRYSPWLDRYFEALQTNNEAQSRFVEQTADEMTPLFQLIRLLWATLQPVSPSSRFRSELKQHLLAEARRRHAQDTLGFEPAPAPTRRVWWVPVAALGTASVVGVYAFWRRSRRSPVEDIGLAA
ncbi:MAG: hypothetical protein GXP38_04420 [Chloroflexi bacterium]|nr:hypothetical protein [Chloroflexota bacterium]